MSQKNIVKSSAGFLVFDWNIRNIEGKFLTFIESLGLKDTQEKAVKDIVRDIIYGLYRESQVVSSEFVDKILEDNQKRSLSQTEGILPK